MKNVAVAGTAFVSVAKRKNIIAFAVLLSLASTIGTAGAVDVCSDAKRTIHYDVAAIDVNIPINGWGDFNPQGMMYALNNPQALPNVAQIKDPDFKLYNTTDMTPCLTKYNRLFSGQMWETASK